MAAPYFLASGITLSSDAREAFTLLIRHLPGAARRPASSAAGFDESICGGRNTAPEMAVTTRRIISGSSTPGRPTFTSRICAPASSCSIAWETM